MPRLLAFLAVIFWGISSSKPQREQNPIAISAGNMVIIPVYVFSRRPP